MFHKAFGAFFVFDPLSGFKTSAVITAPSSFPYNLNIQLFINKHKYYYKNISKMKNNLFKKMAPEITVKPFFCSEIFFLKQKKNVFLVRKNAKIRKFLKFRIIDLF